MESRSELQYFELHVIIVQVYTQEREHFAEFAV